MNSPSKRLAGIALIVAPFVLGVACTLFVLPQWQRYRVSQNTVSEKNQLVATQPNTTASSSSIAESDEYPEAESLEVERSPALRKYLNASISSSTERILNSVSAKKTGPPLVLTDLALTQSTSTDGAYELDTDISRVKLGDTFTVTSGCGNRTNQMRYTLNSISIDEKYGSWKMSFTEQSIYWKNIEYLENGTTKEVMKGPLPPEQLILESGLYAYFPLPSSDPYPVLYGANGVFEPIFVSPNEVYFQYSGTSC